MKTDCFAHLVKQTYKCDRIKDACISPLYTGSFDLFAQCLVEVTIITFFITIITFIVCLTNALLLNEYCY